MAKHDWLVDGNGDEVIVDEYPGFPYCMYIRCVRCDNDFCTSGCDGDILNNECPNGQLELFTFAEVL